MRRWRERVALLIAPWLERPPAVHDIDVRGAGYTTEDTALKFAERRVTELKAEGVEVADLVTVLYDGVDGQFRVGSVYSR